ncbi:MAG: long-chain fatty acid--CoA ligase [Verrucomicrobia bacterium]|nr:long-chain fatty acid--CoA ligase [Verrucomicrobiota bacterium]
MTSELSDIAARVREFIASSIPETACSYNVPAVGGSISKASQPEQSLAGQEKQCETLALALFSLQFAHNPPYRRICEARGIVPAKVGHWSQIPAVPTAAFKELEVSCLPATERTTVFHSSGTTAQRPSRHVHSAESLKMYEASLWPWFERCVLADLKSQNVDFSVAILTPPPDQAPNSSLAYMFEAVRRRLNAPATAFLGASANDGTWSVDCESVARTLREASEAATPLVLIGTAFGFVHLLDFLTEADLRFSLPAGSRVMETGGYKGRSRALPKAELHALLTQRLGVPAVRIICEYGMSELSSQAYGGIAGDDSRITPHASRVFHFPPWVRAQIISPETGREVAEGETGLLRVFDLANVFSVMAIQTEDLGVCRGAGFELIGRAELAESRGCSLMTA